jgi:hypothetical protein
MEAGYLIFLPSVLTGISDSSFRQAGPIRRRLQSHEVYSRDTRASNPRREKKGGHKIRVLSIHFFNHQRALR